jgi:hypothetical protein
LRQGHIFAAQRRGNRLCRHGDSFISIQFAPATTTANGHTCLWVTWRDYQIHHHGWVSASMYSDSCLFIWK